MDRKWQYAYIVIPLVIVLGAIYVLRGGPGGDEPRSDECTSAPAAPTDLRATREGGPAGSPVRVRLSWQPPNGGDAATIYVVEAGSTSGASNVGNFVANTPSYETDAPPGKYYVRVRGQNACGSSDPSNEIIVDVP